MNNENAQKHLIRLNQPQSGSDLVPSPGSTNVLQLDSNTQIDLSGLTLEQQQQLKIKHAEASIAISRKKQEIIADVGALNHSLEVMAHNTSEVAAAGADVTITHTQDNSLGRTEVMMGTSDAAKKGKLTRSQTGQADHTYLFAGVAIFIVIVIALLMVAMSR